MNPRASAAGTGFSTEASPDRDRPTARRVGFSRVSGRCRLIAACLIAAGQLSHGNEPATKQPAPGKPGTESSAGEAGQSLFDGKSLKGWKVTDFAGHGDVKVEDGKLLLETGVMTGITWTNELPRMNYELTLEAMRVDGSDFFCGLTFPIGADPCSFIVGGWGGGVVGLSSIDGADASQNETTQYMNFENGKWFKIRLKVTKGKIEAWIDSDKVVNVDTQGKLFSIRPEVESSKPLGIAAWSTSAALRNIRIRKIP